MSMGIFEGLIGNEEALRFLAEDFTRDRAAGAYLLHGPTPLGKKIAAFRIAQAANCEASQPGMLRLCGNCASCKKVESENHPFIHYLTPTDTAHIKADFVRQTLELLSLKLPSRGRQFLIIDPAEALTPTSSNALLKTIEEPPPATTIFLISAHPRKLLATVVSRCRRVVFHPLPRQPLISALVNQHGLTPEAARLAAALSDGTFALAREEDSEAILRLRGEAVDLLETLLRRDLHKAFERIIGWKREERAFERLFPLFESLLRDCAVLRSAGEGMELFHEDLRAPLEEYSRRFTPRALVELVRRIAETRNWTIENNANRELALNRLFMAMTPGLDPGLG